MSVASSAPRMLVVHRDERQRALLRTFLEEELGWVIVEANNVESALASIGEFRPHVVLAELVLPGAHGNTVLHTMNEHASGVPLIVLVENGDEPAALRALQHGAAGYAYNNNFEEELPEIVERVASAVRSNTDRRRLKSCLTRIDHEFTLENDLSMVPVLVAEVQDDLSWMGFLDRNGRIRLGVALEESLLNAMIHGNLEVSSDLRQEDEAHYRNAINERRFQKPYSQRRVKFITKLHADRAEFVVSDDGPGFDPTQLPDPTDPANLERIGGRGLLLIRTFMDEVKFNKKGNRITMVKHQPVPTPDGFL